MSVFMPVLGPLIRVLGALWRVVGAFSNFLDRFYQYFVAIMIIGMWGLLSLYMINRWLDYKIQMGWTPEITGFLIVWSIFLMIGPVSKLNQHIKVAYMPVRLLGERRGMVFLAVVENLVGLAIGIYMTIQAYKWIARTKEIDYVQPSAGGWDYPMWIVRLGILLGFIFLIFIYFERTVNLIRDYLAQKGKVAGSGSGEAEPDEKIDGQALTASQENLSLGEQV